MTNKAAQPKYIITLVFSFFLSFLFIFIKLSYGQDRPAPDSILHALVPEWHISGSNTMRSDYYSDKGDSTQSPYQRKGLMFYNDLNINFNKRASQYDIWRGEVSGVINDSMYRNNFYGLVPERLNLTREKGDTVVPYRLEMGDIFSYFTYRTMQTSLKGIQLDLQPFQDSNRKHSIFLTSGAQIASWRDFQPRDSYFNGISYLIEDPVLGKYTINLVNNMRQGSADETSLWRTQNTFSIAGSNTIPIGNQNILLEGELSMFKGDHDGFGGDPETGQNRSDKAIFFQASGKSKLPLTYRARYEEYGRDYRPVGAAISPATRNMEGHLGWSFQKGYQIRGRAQKTRDGLESDNPTDTIVYGLNLTGPLGSIDAFMQDAKNKDETTDSLTHNININLNLPKVAGWIPRLGYQYQNMYNRVPGSNDNEINQINLNATHTLSFWTIEGSITPGVVVRKINNPTSRAWEYNPTLALNLKKDKHSLDYNLSWYDQRRLIVNNPDLTTTTMSLNYRYTEKKYIIGFECSSGYRVPDPGRSTDYYKIGAYFTYYFEKPPVKIQAVKADIAPAAPIPSPVIVDIAALPPGLKLTNATDILKQKNIVKPVSQDGILVYEARVFEEIELRQRIALIHKNDILNKSAVIIDFNITDRPQDIMQAYQRVTSILIEKYGNPTNFYERGTFGVNLVDDIRNDRFIRYSEWSRPNGTIRFGIPRKLDGKIRMELQFASTFPPPGETLWSIEEVR